MSRPFAGVQRIVLHGNRWEAAQHLVLCFGPGSSPQRFLQLLRQDALWPEGALQGQPFVQLSLGFSRRGLENARVPPHVLARFALKSPAFSSSASRRAAQHLGITGNDAPQRWDPVFAHTTLDAVLSLHGRHEARMQDMRRRVCERAAQAGVDVMPLPLARRLALRPDGSPAAQDEQWVHFGYRDGLTRVGIEGWPCGRAHDPCAPGHAAGEFVLGMAQDSGANPWIAGPGRTVWPAPVRAFFHEGSFGVLHQIEQNVAAFEAFVAEASALTGLQPDELKAKLCGRYPGGTPVGHPKALATDAFDYTADPQGIGCPFGSHMRRMNPRGDNLVHGLRSRALLRRGMPYTLPECRKPGLMGLFFCASIEDQYEHLLGQWADRVPMGSQDRGGARDPLIGAHASDDGPYEIPRAGQPPLRLHGLQPFTRTLGVAYLFYPSLPTLEGIADNRMWLERDAEDPPGGPLPHHAAARAAKAVR
ncbi:hypothetical protein [Pseudorhodoferax sp. Leaf267]|uniref:hypothetical protein n=1 Tax=Pseudorhodoferax sp. Leaf267 TaxID=1736316 RepID=UPI000B338410|nr:hypothetical protein [Pseudorhodoferax sp. Leaf267]